MIIKKVAFGNLNEAFIENRFENKTNVIFSNDNNRGKTLLMQSLIYSIGYDSIFPNSFNSKEYYFYSKIEIMGSIFEFLRKGNSILVINKEKFNVFTTISEFKYYFDKEIFKLPKIDKNGEQKLVDLSLLYEIFFLGQDNRNTSNLIVKGQNNKGDFLNMIYSFLGVSVSVNNKYDIENLKKEKSLIETKIRTETRKIKVIKQNPQIATFISSTSNNLDFKNISNQLNEVHSNIAELKKQRNREENRKIKLENLITELSSLNRSLNEGKVKCLDCGSNKIVFTNDNFEFEVSNNYVRKNIIESITNTITIKSEIIDELNDNINKELIQINKLLESSTPEVKNYILFQDEITDSKDVDQIVSGLQKELKEIEKKLQNNEIKITSNKDLQKSILSNIILEMKNYYSKIDPQGLLVFEDLFTKAGETYSGSEGQEYYFCKLMSLNKILLHKFPIIIDSFREGELSSSKETSMLNEYIKLDKQVILTSTLKDEEYDADKYYKFKNLNVIDYSMLADSKILQSNFVPKFKKILDKFNIKK
ncbi:MAG: hypothetical protein LBI72_12645 [Flavobacteriaceae bacterium]|jgi:ribosomal protein S27E|nr:hypothetical protein [Flavobacteriaceae bacterium]